VFEVSGLSMIQVLNNASDEVKTWTQCVTVETDLETVGFTALDRQITSGVVCYPQASVSPSSVKKSAAIESNNLDIKGLIDNERLSDLDLRAGKYSGAKVKVFIVDFITGAAIKTLTVGKWGQVKKTDQTWEITVRTNADILQQSVFQSLSRTCRWAKRLEDPRCGFDIADATTDGEVIGVENAIRFTIDATNFPGFGDNVSVYNWGNGSGYVQYLTGNNAGYRLPINFVYNPGGGAVGVQLLNTPPYAVNVGDTLQLIPGCDGSMIMCKYRYNNEANFGGISDGAHFFPTKEKLRQ
jgi:uncharacterized phage protein (TIGR02218 family)